MAGLQIINFKSNHNTCSGMILVGTFLSLNLQMMKVVVFSSSQL